MADNPASPRTVKKSVSEMIGGLEGDEYPMPVRAANAISALDDVTQDPNMPSHVRVSLWQAVSKLASIR